MRTREQCSGRLRGAKAAPARTPLLSGLWLSGLNNAGKRGKMVQAATLAPAAAPSPSRQKGQPAKRGALQRVAPPALEAPEEAAEAPAAGRRLASTCLAPPAPSFCMRVWKAFMASITFMYYHSIVYT